MTQLSICGQNYNLEIEKKLSCVCNALRGACKSSDGRKPYNMKCLKENIDEFGKSFPKTNRHTWLKFINELVYNDSRLEGLKISKQKASQIITDLRIQGDKSKYNKTKFKTDKNIVELAGLASVYDYILNTNEEVCVYSVKDLHKILFKFAPHSEQAGSYRGCNNRINGAKVETLDYSLLPQEMLMINKDIDYLIKNRDKMNSSDYVDRCVQIHYYFIIAHPFIDGNGRIGRALLNWLFKAKGLPPVFIKSRYKQEYHAALEKAYLTRNFNDLQLFFYQRIFESLKKLNEIE